MVVIGIVQVVGRLLMYGGRTNARMIFVKGSIERSTLIVMEQCIFSFVIFMVLPGTANVSRVSSV